MLRDQVFRAGRRLLQRTGVAFRSAEHDTLSPQILQGFNEAAKPRPFTSSSWAGAARYLRFPSRPQRGGGDWSPSSVVYGLLGANAAGFALWHTHPKFMRCGLDSWMESCQCFTWNRLCGVVNCAWSMGTLAAAPYGEPGWEFQDPGPCPPPPNPLNPHSCAGRMPSSPLLT